MGERGKREGWVRRRDGDPLRIPRELGARAGTGALARAGNWEAAAETCQPCRMRLRLFCILLAAVSGAQGWGYCECGARRPAGLGPGAQSLQGGSRAALRLGGRGSLPGRRELACFHPSLPLPRAPQCSSKAGARTPGRGWLGPEPRIESAPAGIWD